MLKSKKSVTVVLIFSFIAVFIAGCGNSAQDSALIGAVIGTGIGAIAGGDGTSMLIGGTIGSGVGYWIGNEQEKNRAVVAKKRDYNTLKNMNEYETVWITNSNGSKTPVKMTRSEYGYIGPRNDYYASLPSTQQLKSAYGF